MYLLRLLGGSIINAFDPVSALDYKAIDIREIRSNAYKTEHFFSKETIRTYLEQLWLQSSTDSSPILHSLKFTKVITLDWLTNKSTN